MIKDGKNTIGLSRTETYQNEEIIFESIEEKLKSLNPIDKSIRKNGQSVEIYKLESGQFVYRDSVGEILVANNRNGEFEKGLADYYSILQVPTKPNGPYAMRNLQTSKGDYCFTYGYNMGDKSGDMTLTIGDSGLVLKKGIVENYIDLDSTDKKELSKIFLQACVERYVGAYTSEVYNELSGNDMSNMVNAQNNGQNFSEIDWHIISVFSNQLDDIKDEKIMKKFYKKNLGKDVPDNVLDDIIGKKIQERKRKNYKDIVDVEGQFRQSEETENNLKGLVIGGITKKDILKYLLEDGKVRAGTLEEQQALIRNTLELDRSEEKINQLFD